MVKTNQQLRQKWQPSQHTCKVANTQSFDLWYSFQICKEIGNMCQTKHCSHLFQCFRVISEILANTDLHAAHLTVGSSTQLYTLRQSGIKQIYFHIYGTQIWFFFVSTIHNNSIHKFFIWHICNIIIWGESKPDGVSHLLILEYYQLHRWWIFINGVCQQRTKLYQFVSQVLWQNKACCY